MQDDSQSRSIGEGDESSVGQDSIGTGSGYHNLDVELVDNNTLERAATTYVQGFRKTVANVIEERAIIVSRINKCDIATFDQR